MSVPGGGLEEMWTTDFCSGVVQPLAICASNW